MKKWLLQGIGFLIAFGIGIGPVLVHGSDETISGNLTVSGTIDSAGDTLSLGTRADTGAYPGWGTLYTDGSTSSTEFDATRSANIWKWQQNGSTALQLQMKLDNNNALTLYNQSATPNAAIVLNPLGTSSFVNSITINGIDSEMPNQTLVNSNSVLTEGLADSRYISVSSIAIGTAPDSGPTFAVNGGTATGDTSFASGNGSIASGAVSTAIGSYNTSSGWGSTTIGEYTSASNYYSLATGNLSAASGVDSTAMGYYTTASNYYSVAMGYKSNASGYGSTALGTSTIASGTDATAGGLSTTAAAYDSFVVGRSNVGGGNATSWVATDPLFEVGNGGSVRGSLTDALVVYKNGNAAVQGTLSAGGAITTTSSINAASLSTTGAISAGSIASSGIVTAQPGGDIPMYSGN